MYTGPNPLPDVHIFMSFLRLFYKSALFSDVVFVPVRPHCVFEQKYSLEIVSIFPRVKQPLCAMRSRMLVCFVEVWSSYKVNVSLNVSVFSLMKRGFVGSVLVLLFTTAWLWVMLCFRRLDCDCDCSHGGGELETQKPK